MAVQRRKNRKLLYRTVDSPKMKLEVHRHRIPSLWNKMTIESILPAKHTINEIHISSIAISVTAAILWYWTISTLYCLFFHPLRNVPGPFLAKVSQLWRNYRYFRGTWHDDAIDIHEKYGRLVRIAPNEVSFVDEHGLKALYGHGKQIKKVC